MLIQILTTLLALVVAVFISYLLSTRLNNRTIIRDALTGALLSTAIMTMFWMQYEAHKLRDLRSALVEDNVLDNVGEMLAKLSPKDPMAEPLRETRDTLAHNLEILLSGTIELQDEQEVIDQWIHGVRTAATTIDATNVVDPNYWKEGSRFSSVQKKLQEQATKKGIRIRRIFLFDNSKNDQMQVIRQLGQQQSQIRVSVRYLSIQKARSTQATLKSLSKLGGTLDFVIFDINRVLLTYTLPINYSINKGKITQTRAVVDAAQQLYEELWSIARDQL